jgi:hypothetical protein
MHYNALFDKGRRDAIRGAVASGDLNAVLRKQAETPAYHSPLSVLIPKPPGVPMEEAIRRADESGVVIASNIQIDSKHTGDEWETIKDAIPGWTGTMACYVEPDKSFREAGEWVDALKSHAIIDLEEETKIRYLFPIPEEHLDKKNAILITEHPDFRLESDGKDRIVMAARICLIERFPVQGGWYNADPQFGIPFGDKSLFSIPDTRYLIRIEKRIGLVVRGCDSWSDFGTRGVILNSEPSWRLGMVVEKTGAKA